MAHNYEAFLQSEVLNHDAVLSSEGLLLGLHRQGKLDTESTGHSLRTALAAGAVAHELKLETPRIVGLYVSGHVHDIGKVHHNDLYTSEKKLTNDHRYELHVRDTHPYRGFCMCRAHWHVEAIEGPDVVDADIERYATVMTLGHHMLFKTQPRRSVSVEQMRAYVHTKDITMFEAKGIISTDGIIFARVDVADAIQSNRPYLEVSSSGERKPLTADEKRKKAYGTIQREIKPIKGLTTQELFDVLDEHKELIEYYTELVLGKFALSRHAIL